MTAGQISGMELQQRLGNFRPSDRDRFRQAFSSDAGNALAEAAIRAFVEGWEDKSWVEAYSIERIGKWLAVNAPEATVSRLDAWARQRQTQARKALRKGLRDGRELPQDDKALLITS